MVFSPTAIEDFDRDAIRKAAWKAANLHPSHLCWSADGWELAAEGSVQCALTNTRAQARSYLTFDYDWTEIGVWKRYIRPLGRQERYEWWVESRDGGWDEHPDVVPDDWEDNDDEDAPSWEICLPDHPEAWPVWICGEQKHGPPFKPSRRALLDRQEARDGDAS